MTWREERLKTQVAQWPAAVEAGKKGNPLATMCLHCYGRHPPPLDELCPNDPPPKRANEQ